MTLTARTTTSPSWWTRRSRSPAFFRVTNRQVSCRERSLISQCANSATFTCFMQSQLLYLTSRIYWLPPIAKCISSRVYSWCRPTSSLPSRSPTMSSHFCYSPMWPRRELEDLQTPFRSSTSIAKGLDGLKPISLLVSLMKILVALYWTLKSGTLTLQCFSRRTWSWSMTWLKVPKTLLLRDPRKSHKSSCLKISSLKNQFTEPNLQMLQSAFPNYFSFRISWKRL